MGVQQLITAAQGYAQTTITQATSALNDAKSMVSAIGYVIPNAPKVSLPDAPSTSLNLVLPTLDNITLDLPSEPSQALEFQDIAAIEAGPVPVLTANPPELNFPTAPAAMVEFTQVAPIINTNIVFPEPPSQLTKPMIPEPELQQLTVPTKPEVSLPVFGAIAPQNNTVAPTDYEARFNAAYLGATPATVAMIEGFVSAQLTKINPRYHDQMARIESQLTKYLDGGTGVKPEVENAIYARARSKNDAEARRVGAAAFSDVVARGFTLPTGALSSAMQQARQAAADNNATAAREIVVMQAEMEQKNLQFAVTTSSGLRTAMVSASLNYMQNLVSINGQSLDYAKTVLSAIIEVYNTAVKAYGLKLDAYRAEASVYETRLKSALAGIDLYKTEIDALVALTSVDKTKLDVYRARIDSLGAYANVYRAQIDAVQSRASLEKLKLELFQSQVQAYSARVQGKNAEYQGYTSAITGETAKAQVFRNQVEAFNAQIQGFKTSIDAKSEVVRAAALTNRARADQYQATLQGYTSVVQARGEKARTQLENQRQSVVAFQVQSQSAIAKYQVQSEYYKSVSLVAIENAKLNISAQIQTADSTRAFGASIAQLGVSSAQVYSGLAGAAMSGMNTLSAQVLSE